MYLTRNNIVRITKDNNNARLAVGTLVVVEFNHRSESERRRFYNSLDVMTIDGNLIKGIDESDVEFVKVGLFSNKELKKEAKALKALLK
jgi:hypothetical protein